MFVRLMLNCNKLLYGKCADLITLVNLLMCIVLSA